MPIINQYRVYCQTEAALKTVWLPDGEAAPTTCPSDTSHAVDAGQTVIIGSAGNAAPLNAEGALIVAPTFEDTGGVYPQWKGHLYTAVAGAMTIFDELVTYEEQLREGHYELLDTNAVIGDYIEESIIDKDDVLGYFAAYGYVVGQDVLELKKYINKEYINPLTAGQRQKFKAESTTILMPGLYMRTTYTSIGAVDVQFKVTTVAYS